MSSNPGFVVERWTRLSAASSIVAGAVLIVMVFGPLLFSANIVDSLTTLFIYIILAAMWNALAGYAGLISVGQQAFFGLGAYFAIQLSDHGVEVYLALVLGAAIAGLLSLPISLLMLRLRGGEFAIAMWVVAELAHLLVALDPLVNGETGVSLLALNAFGPEQRRDYNYWMSLAAMVGLLALLFALLRGVGSCHPRRRGCRRIGGRACARRQADHFLFDGVWMRAGRHVVVGDIGVVPAGDEFRHPVDGLYDFHGAGRRARHLRGADPGRDYFLPD
jgi:hypothetical protein